MINKTEALKIAYNFLNDKSVKIISYAETTTSFIFQYVDKYTNSPIFDNSMIEVNKDTNKASIYMVTQNLNELKKMTFKDAN